MNIQQDQEHGTPLLSVITVCYNAGQLIIPTVESVINQTWFNRIEYLVIDGASSDNTLNLLEPYIKSIDQLLSEPDKGIYDAMNKGLNLAKGEYVLFMNAGDCFYADDTVEKVFLSEQGADIYYGETEMINAGGESLGRRRHKAPEKFSWKSFRFGMSISHQAIYIRRALTNPYNLDFKLSADIDWILQAAKKAETIVNTHRYVARYLVGGMSKQRHRQSLTERFQIFNHYYGLIPNVLAHVVIGSRLFFYFIRHRRTND